MRGWKSGVALRVASGLSVLLLSLGSVRGQDLMNKKSFEGVLTVEVQNFESIQFYTYSVKYERIRVEPAESEDNDAIVVIDYMGRKTDIILSGREQYVELPFPAELSETQHKKEEMMVQKTGESEEIQGFACDKLTTKSDGNDIEVWATKDLGVAGTFLTAFSAGALHPTPWKLEILSMGYFPLRVIERDSTGEEQSRVEVTSVQKKTMNELLFRVPDGYEKVNLDVVQPKQPPMKRRAR